MEHGSEANMKVELNPAVDNYHDKPGKMTFRVAVSDFLAGKDLLER